jgi:hypothetical protein
MLVAWACVDVGGLWREEERTFWLWECFISYISFLWERYAWVREGVGELDSGRRRERWMCIVRELGNCQVVS